MTNLFLFDAFSFSYYLAVQIGDVEPGSSAYLLDHELTFEKNFSNGFGKASMKYASGKRIYGVLFSLTDEQYKLVKEKLLPNYHLELKSVHLNRKRTAETFVPEQTSNLQTELPKRWYLDLMLAGLREVVTPESYIKMIDALPSDNTFHGHGGFAKSVLKYPGTPKKHLKDAFNKIELLQNGGTFIIKAPRHSLNHRPIILSKEEPGFSFETSTLYKKGYQDPREFIVDNPDLELSGTYKIGKKSFVANNIQHGVNEKIVTGTIQGISSVKINDSNYWRLLVPIPQKFDPSRDFVFWSYLTDGRLSNGLLKIRSEVEVHVYGIKKGSHFYIVFDALGILPLKRFQKITYAVILTYAFLKGNFYSGEGYYINYDNEAMQKVSGIVYQQMSDGRFDLPGIFTTNPFTSVEQVKFRRNKHGMIPQKLIESRRRGLDEFTAERLTDLVNLILTDSKVREALTLITQNQQATLEIRIPVLYVALELITGVFSTGGNKDLKPISDNKTAAKLIDELQSRVWDFAKENNFNEQQMTDLKVFANKIANLNQPPNTDKLSKVFPILGYELRTRDTQAINDRNAFLHGFTPKIKLSEEDHGFKELFDLSLRLHFLLGVLLLKKVGYKGKVINYNKLYEHITQIDRSDEDILVMI